MMNDENVFFCIFIICENTMFRHAQFNLFEVVEIHLGIQLCYHVNTKVNILMMIINNILKLISWIG